MSATEGGGPSIEASSKHSDRGKSPMTTPGQNKTPGKSIPLKSDSALVRFNSKKQSLDNSLEVDSSINFEMSTAKKELISGGVGTEAAAAT